MVGAAGVCVLKVVSLATFASLVVPERAGAVQVAHSGTIRGRVELRRGARPMERRPGRVWCGFANT